MSPIISTKEDQENLVMRIRQGDEDAARELVQLCELVVKNVAHTFIQRFPRYADEFLAEGNYVLGRMLSRYDGSRGAKFTTAFAVSLRYHYLTMIRRFKKRAYWVSVDDVDIDDNNNATDERRRVLGESITAIVEKLPPLQRGIIKKDLDKLLTEEEEKSIRATNDGREKMTCYARRRLRQIVRVRYPELKELIA